MQSLIDGIQYSSLRKPTLFFKKDKLGEEVRTNLVSIPLNSVSITAKGEDQLFASLVSAFDRIEAAVREITKGQDVILYSWCDKAAHLLRWTVISDLKESKLPFSSTVNEVDIRTLIRNLTNVTEQRDQLTIDDIDHMPIEELNRINRSAAIPIIDVYVRRIKEVA